MIDQVAGHAEADIAFGTDVLCGELEGTYCGGKEGGENGGWVLWMCEKW